MKKNRRLVFCLLVIIAGGGCVAISQQESSFSLKEKNLLSNNAPQVNVDLVANDGHYESMNFDSWVFDLGEIIRNLNMSISFLDVVLFRLTTPPNDNVETMVVATRNDKPVVILASWLIALFVISLNIYYSYSLSFFNGLKSTPEKSHNY